MGAHTESAPNVGEDTSAQIARFVSDLRFEDLSDAVICAAKNRLLDTLACGIGAIGVGEIDIVRSSIALSHAGACSVYGTPLRASATEAAMMNTAMTRNLDYMDTYTGPHGGGHPSNALGPILACAELSSASPRVVLTALVAATEVLGAFADVVNCRQRSGIEHLGYVGIAMTAGAGKALGLDSAQIQQAISLTAVSYNPLQVTRAEQITMWKGFAAGYAALMAVQSCILASNGMQGPSMPFDGRTGWKEVVAKQDFDLTFSAGERILAVWTKLYLAESYGLSAVEAAISLGQRYPLTASNIHSVTLRSFAHAVSRLGGGEGRDPYRVTTRPEADHSFPYMIAAALLDGELSLAQYSDERINRDDVQALLKKVGVREDEELNSRFSTGIGCVPAALEVVMANGETAGASVDFFSGHPARPATRQQIVAKLEYLASGNVENMNRISQLVAVVDRFEDSELSELMQLIP